jgi:predicted DNA binding CopG/RHH family protein
MSSKSTEINTTIQDIEEIAQQAHAGQDISEHFTGDFQVKQQVTIALPLELLNSIKAECQLQNIELQDWIKGVCAEKIREVQTHRMSQHRMSQLIEDH